MLFRSNLIPRSSEDEEEKAEVGIEVATEPDAVIETTLTPEEVEEVPSSEEKVSVLDEEVADEVFTAPGEHLEQL